MKAIVFAAGLGTRLKPFTEHHPKALAPVGNTTALGLVVDRLVSAGADGIVVNVHHFADQVIDWLGRQDYPVEIEISDERELLLDTGGALAKIWRESEIISRADDSEAIIVHNADILTDAPVDGLTAALEGADVSLLVDSARETSRYLLFDKSHRLAGRIDTRNDIVTPGDIDPSAYRRAAFGGVHAMRRGVLEDISLYCGDELHPFGIIPYYLDRRLRLDIRGYMPEKPYGWFDIGTPEKLQAAQDAITNGFAAK